MPMVLAYRSRERLLCPGTRAAGGHTRSELHSKPSRESRSFSCAVLQQKNGDEAVKMQVIPQSAQLAVGWGGAAGSQACRRFSKTMSGLVPVSPATSLATEPGSHLPACPEVWGHSFLAGVHLHNLWC